MGHEIKSSYDIDSGWVKLRIPKVESGHFEDLDMLTKLLDEKPRVAHTPLIQVMESSEAPSLRVEEEEWDWHLDQELPQVFGLI